MRGRGCVLQGACIAGGVHGRGHAWCWGTCVAVGDGGGGWVVRAEEAATEAGGTHPTGMHTCNLMFYCFDRSSLRGGQTVR